jgi:hypothetical protein
MAIIIVIVILLVAAFSAYFVSQKVLSALRKKESKLAMMYSGLTFVMVFAVIIGTIAYVIISNMDFGR